MFSVGVIMQLCMQEYVIVYIIEKKPSWKLDCILWCKNDNLTFVVHNI